MAIVTLVGITYFVVIVAVLHFLSSGYNAVVHTTSHYAVGPFGPLMSSAFLSMCVASLALVVGLYWRLPPPARSRTGLLLLGVWGIALLIVMFFPINPDGTPLTTSGRVHRIVGPVGFLSLSLGALLVSRRFGRDADWRRFHRTALALSFAILAAFIVTLVNVAIQSGYAGLSQRILLAVTVVWYVLTAVRLRSSAKETASQASVGAV